jgi:hypothetical protein
MPKVDVAIVQEPLPSTLQPDSSLGKQLQVIDPEGVTLGDDENPEFKLPKMSSLVVVLTTNLLMQERQTDSFVNENCPYIIVLNLVQEEISDLFYGGSVPGFLRPTAHHKVPQTVRDTILRVLSIRSRREQPLGDPRVNDHSATREVGEGYFLGNAFEYQHRERVCVGLRCRREIVV